MTSLSSSYPLSSLDVISIIKCSSIYLFLGNPYFSPKLPSSLDISALIIDNMAQSFTNKMTTYELSRKGIGTSKNTRV